MSQRFKANKNENASKNTRLDVAGEFAGFRFGRDQLAHVTRYLFICEWMIKEAKRIKRPLSILDIGCGDVYVARVLNASFVVKKRDVVRLYTGLDIDNVILERASNTLPTSMDIELICDDFTTGALEQFKNKQFDFVICTEVIEHVKPKFVILLLSEIKRIAKRAIISTPNFDGGTGHIPEDHIKEWKIDDLLVLMNEVGIKPMQSVGVFCNLQHVKKLCKANAKLKSLYDYLEPRMDSDLLSLCMARFIGLESQNVMHVCEL